MRDTFESDYALALVRMHHCTGITFLLSSFIFHLSYSLFSLFSLSLSFDLCSFFLERRGLFISFCILFDIFIGSLSCRGGTQVAFL